MSNIQEAREAAEAAQQQRADMIAESFLHTVRRVSAYIARVAGREAPAVSFARG
jgi:hypothetical protein